ncbi:bifunctional UDP-sugar hydrolase/5'-nucleotidase [Pasteurellaceae bacterium USgator11]|nr:bifunctional UDP-sugar hydrolase/5'-nucleotidase [Pasteurellaceae bacterium UScroc12]TNG97583.1 bifunctional UDP-sugar hydrolase/5'-nucleotidase [Pasteurellaceae bacterium UScroc31]TNG97789.1 bifunctional UDP-sugar hydrolase/5'-nucleotidase [Pasteurellaceae bacterium USgator41]TNG98276.1 bifunctional UDP-sugar hydrolase/5'-nucleotidase [Pasteurellaceae bacterium USgator11]
MKSLLKLSTCAGVILSTLAFSGLAQAEYEKDRTYQLTVLHTNDLHGRFWTNQNGEYGLAAQKTLIDRIRKEVTDKGGDVILLNAGDYNTGIPESDLQNAKPDIEAMNIIGYEALVLGNHEFDNPLQLLDMQESWAKFPFLSANVFNKKDGSLLVKPYTILDKQGLKVAVVGLTTEDTAKLGNPEFISNVEFIRPAEAAKDVLASLNSNEKPDIKIGLTHMGYYHDAQYGSNAPGDVSMARELEKGAFDMILGGHSHDTVCINDDGSFNLKYKPGDACKPAFENGTWIMQAGEWGKYVGRADFEFKNGDLKLVGYQLIPVNLKDKVKNAEGKTEYVLFQEEIVADPELLAHLKTYQDKGDELLGVEVGSVNEKLEGDRNVIRFQQTNLGQLIARSQKERAKADIGIMNSGGIRASIEPGKVTYKDILTVQPFGNIISYVELNGQELLDYLDVVALKEIDSGAYAQFAGISMTVDRAAKKVSDVKINGEALDLKKTYRVSLPSFSAAGGDGYPVVINNPTYVNTGFVDAESLKLYFEENSPIDASQFKNDNEIIYK